MRLNLNLMQRTVLALAGAFFVLLALSSMIDYPQDKRLGTIQFLIAFVLFVVAASSRREKTNAE